MNPREKADIVDRLLKSAAAGDVPYYRDDSNNVVFHADNMEEAATEIASLRRELAELREDKRIVDELLDAAIRNLAGEKADG